MFLFLNFPFILNQQNHRFNVTEDILEIIRCVNSTEKFSEEIKTTILSAYEKKDNSIFRIIGELLLTHSIEMKKCMPKHQIPNNLNEGIMNNNFFREKKFNEIIEKRYNWNDFLKCLNTQINDLTENEIADSIFELIEQINNKDYLLAIRNQFRLKRFGNQIVINCNIHLNKNDDLNES